MRRGMSLSSCDDTRLCPSRIPVLFRDIRRRIGLSGDAVDLGRVSFDPAAPLGRVLRQTGETSFLCFGGVSDGRWVRRRSPGVACETGGVGRAMSLGVAGEHPCRPRRCAYPLPLRSEAANPQTPDSGGAQAGGVSPPFTVCVHSWFEVFGVRRGGEGVGRGWEGASGVGREEREG